MAQTQIMHTFLNIILMTVYLKMSMWPQNKTHGNYHQIRTIKNYNMLHLAGDMKCTHQYQQIYFKRKFDAKVKQLRNYYHSQLVLNYNVNLVNLLFFKL